MMTGEESGRTDLADLVRGRLEEIGMSVRALAAASVDPKHPENGLQWTRTTLDNLLRGARIKPPSLPQLRALHHALRLPLGRVQDAAGGQFFGIDTVWSDDGKVRALVHNYREMTPEDQDWVDSIVESRRDRKRD